MYTPASAGAEPLACIVYFHGGAWIFGNLDTHDCMCRMLANASGCRVISVDYRLAPEHKFPAAVEDSYAATEWIAAHSEKLGVDPARIAVGGDSAGGNLAAIVTQIARDRCGPNLVFQLLIYPATDMQMGLPSVDENADGPLLTKASMTWFVNHYLNSAEDRTN